MLVSILLNWFVSTLCCSHALLRNLHPCPRHLSCHLGADFCFPHLDVLATAVLSTAVVVTLEVARSHCNLVCGLLSLLLVVICWLKPDFLTWAEQPPVPVSCESKLVRNCCKLVWRPRIASFMSSTSPKMRMLSSAILRTRSLSSTWFTLHWNISGI